MKDKVKLVFAGTVLAGTAAALVALVPAPTDRSLDASRIIDSLASPQREVDIPPAAAMDFIRTTPDVDPSQLRLLGQGKAYTYYAAPTSSGTICMFPVDAQGQSEWSGCTLLKGFESYGLRLETADRSESAWLVVPEAAEQSLESAKNEAGWTEQAPNFLLRTSR